LALFAEKVLQKRKINNLQTDFGRLWITMKTDIIQQLNIHLDPIGLYPLIYKDFSDLSTGKNRFFRVFSKKSNRFVKMACNMLIIWGIIRLPSELALTLKGWSKAESKAVKANFSSAKSAMLML